MNVWTIEPRDPLVVRDGRPPSPNMPTARSLDVPWPSTVAGLVRTRSGMDAEGRFQSARVAELLGQGIRGPWLVELDATGEAKDVVFPAPLDVAWTEADAVRLLPGSVAATTNLDAGLQPLVPASPLGAAKPGRAARLWRASALLRWLSEAVSPGPGEVVDDLPHERRMHVGLDGGTQTASEGKLFVSDGVRYWTNDIRLGLGFEAAAGLSPGRGVVKLGGEGRLSMLRPGGRSFPAAPPALRAELERRRQARVVLLTPAIFDGGALPKSRTLFGARVFAARVDRPEVVSGWDAARGQPKPTRRVVPAGSVYWVDLSAVGAVDAWLERSWGRAVEEQAGQDQRDGFGLAAVGVP